ncbi:type I restriction-modification system subunit M N-terminal domain-containing protein, partial [Staphylococcus sp. GDX8P80P]|uniref:type I restriction-modification system subunit M N-terminal domain-containing protein n=1 Tax=Staphylococcus sp. GDX8P80P TaxID=2804104 RepID=UPI001AEC1C49
MKTEDDLNNVGSNVEQRQQQAELQKKLWSIANDLRGNMDASEFRNYILGLIFYRFLSEKTEEEVAELLKEDNISYTEAWEDEEY